MKVSIPISDFRDALNVASLTLSKRLGSADNALLYLDARKNAIGGSIYLFSFDGVARTFVKLAAEVEEEGKTVINPTTLIGSLAKVVREGNLTLQQGDKKDVLNVSGAGRKIKLAASGELDNFDNLLKAMPTAQAENFTISQATFKNLIRQSAPFVERPDKEEVGKDFNRGDTNLLIRAVEGGFEACATEGNALAVVKVTDDAVSDKAEDLKIPIRSVLNLKNMLEKMKGQDIKIIIGRDESGEPRGLYLRTDNIFYGTQLDGSKFRDYQKILAMPTSHTVEIERNAFQALITNATPFVNGLKEEDAVLTLTISKKTIKMQAGKGHETFEEESESESLVWPENQDGSVRVAFNPDYLANVARVVASDKVKISLEARGVIAFFSSETEGVSSTYVVASFVQQAAQPKAA